jgi:tetratricopeptide (TPR) repeat protein
MSAAVLVAACAARRPSEAPKPIPDDLSAHGIAELQAPEPQPEALDSGPAYDLVPAAVVDALAAHDYARALAVADRALGSPSASPWLDYDRAEALAGLGRTDEAIDAFRKAEQRFRAAGGDRAGVSTAKWGRARALAEAGRCSQARGAYDEYAAFVGEFDPPAANLAGARARQCRSVVRLP